MLRIFVVLLLLSLPTAPLFAQNVTLSGTIKAKSSGEDLIGVIVKVKELPNIGAASNEYGFYSLSIPKGSYTIVVSGLSYKPLEERLDLSTSLKRDWLLEATNFTLNEVVVTNRRRDENVRKNEMGATTLDIKAINKLPVIMGERDIVKAIQLTPGVKASGDGNSGFYVRGGAADQNLILLDEAPVYNASHLMGFFSTFNSDAIKDATLYKGSMPAEYGGRLSSVLDVRMNEGNNQEYHASGGIGLISSRLNLEGPIQKGKSSFLVSGRRTYADLFLKLSNDDGIRNSKLYFYDLNAKLNYQIDAKNKIYLSGYFGRDDLGYKDLFGFRWGNTTGTLRWNHIASPKLFSNTSLIFSDFRYVVSVTSNKIQFDIKSNIQDWNLKQEFSWYPNSQHTLKFGFNTIHHTIVPGNISASGISAINSTHVESRYAWENAVFVSDDWKATSKLSINLGLRVSSFSLLGSGSFNTYDSTGTVTSTKSYPSGAFVQTYIVPEPRLGLTYLLNDVSSVKAAYTRTAQYLHLLSNSNAGSPTDLWIPSSPNVKPEIADQVSLGYYRNFKDNLYECSAEIYYKDLQNQIDYKNGAVLNANQNVEADLLYGHGRAYGLELFLKKRTGRLNGWIGYTLSRTERQIQGINSGNWYPARQDQTHDISIVGIYELSAKWSLSGAFVYSTGNAVTFPTGKYEVNGVSYFKYDDRNASRMPAYHRLDLAATYTKHKSKNRESSWSFSLYNAYGHQNAFLINFAADENDPNKTVATQVSLFRFVPSITYNFKF
ncbi:MAG: TonB-dependent receptor [Bacteroidetes bacterium]|nr:TonB-dependent receptor [Bacteroidota bacterium]